MTVPLIETRGLGMRFGGVHAVRDVNFTLGERELRCLIGPNGAGKSTFFKMLTGQLKPTSGAVLLRGEDVTGAEPHEIARRGVGIKTQVPSVFDGLTVRENLWLAATRMHRGAQARAAVDAMLERVGLSAIASRLVGQLAHGQRQWVELGVVLSTDPDLVLLDEPAAGMTDQEVLRTVELVRDINKTKALIVVEHDMQFIRMIASKVTVFNQGAVLMEDDVEAIMHSPIVRDVYLGKTGGGMMLEVSELAAGYGRIPILGGVSFSVARGEFIGILGHNGMGKTTLLRALMGYIPATGGRVMLEGADITRAEPYRRARAGMGYVPQGREIFPGLSVRDNLRMGAVGRPKDEDAAIGSALETFPRLKPLIDRPGGALSGGEQQLLAMARCLVGDPRLVLLDEPTEGIQPSIIDEIVETLLGLRSKGGLTMILVEQNLDFIATLSERVLIIQKGVIVHSAEPGELHGHGLVNEFIGVSD